MSDFKSMLEGLPFTFLIGPAKRSFLVHTGFARGVSEPLDALVNNGLMRESVDKFGVLADVEPETFALFAEYAYTGTYRLVPKAIHGSVTGGNDDCAPDRFKGLDTFRCTGCAQVFPVPHTYFLYCSARCKRTCVRTEYCVACACTDADEINSFGWCIMCSPKSNVHDTKFWEAFKASKHNTANLIDPNPINTLDDKIHKIRPRDEPSDQLASHARLYIFADKYLIQPLKELCLQKLHRDLMVYSLEGDSITELVELIQYTFANSVSGTGGADGELREMVTSYAIGRAELLIEYPEFCATLAMGGDLVPEIVRATTEYMLYNAWLIPASESDED